MDDRQDALHQVEFHAAHVRHAAEFLADQRFFGRAIHLHDADGGAHVAADGFGWRQWDRRGYGSGCSCSAARRVCITVGVRVAVAVMGMVVSMRIVAMSAVRVVMSVKVPFVPVRTGSRPFEAVGFGVVGLRHGGFLVRFVV
ncbi:hypothetical protein [Paraburkholderia dipogonis]|uniref:hypothetical protein n=1 Tax=Paraburkholderia dipogonis TaxID=1211383 RepID=UPI0038BC6AF2